MLQTRDTANTFAETVVGNMQMRDDQVFARLLSESDEIVLTWAGLRVLAGGYATVYRKAGKPSGGTVLIFLRHAADLYGAFFGAMFSGFVPAFMPPLSPKQDPALYWPSHQALLNRIQPAFLVLSRDTYREMIEAGLDLGPSQVILADAVEPREAVFEIPAVNQTALLQHSSGTTGLKKGVALSFDAIHRQIEAYAGSLGLAGDDVICSWLPLYHDMGLIACVILPAFFAVPIVHIDPHHWIGRPETLFKAIMRHSGTLCWMPNFAFEHLAAILARRAAEFRLSGMRAFISCSEPCKPRAFERFAEAFAASGVTPRQLQCCYAMAETVFAVSQTRVATPVVHLRVSPASLEPGEMPRAVDEGGIELLETGVLIDGIDVSVHAPDRAKLEPGRVGEIAIAAPFLFTGYNCEPERTAAAFCDDRYFTRDIGFVRDGHLYVLGRVDDMLIINGRNLFAHEVEAELGSVAGIKPGRAVAVSDFDARSGATVLIVICEKDRRRDDRTDADIKAEAVSRIQSIFNVVPSRCALVEEGWLVKTTSGKISRVANLEKFRQGRGVGP